jgi:hypothetical protein
MRKCRTSMKFTIKRAVLSHCIFLILYLLFSMPSVLQAQEKEVLKSVDSLKTVTTVVDSTAAGLNIKKTRVYDPRKAALRSAVLPGWGQIYNRKYWKLPIVYGALGGSAAYFIYNLANYKDTRFAYKIKYTMRITPTGDSSQFFKIRKDLQPFSEESLRYYRDAFRRDIDYSALFFVILWGLNVVDAAVDAHLKAFDVSPDLSFQFRPGYSEMAGTSGLSFVLHIGKNKQALLPSIF